MQVGQKKGRVKTGGDKMKYGCVVLFVLCVVAGDYP